MLQHLPIHFTESKTIYITVDLLMFLAFMFVMFSLPLPSYKDISNLSCLDNSVKRLENILFFLS